MSRTTSRGLTQFSKRLSVGWLARSSPSGERARGELQHRVEELPLAEIADAMDTTYKAVERLLARARKSLAPLLEDFSEK